MEQRKLTKADIDKVRHIEGFPVAKDEDIIALSRPPYYTACPNPFIADFIAEHGTPYDEATDDYHREPFAADVSEGKNDPIYNAHSYHTKVPHKAIMRYILHYTKPGDIVFDGFCGTGMTGVAAQMCGCPDAAFKVQIEAEMPGVEWGKRKAILSDLSPAATFIAYTYNTPVDSAAFDDEAHQILAQCIAEYGWMYETYHVDQNGKSLHGIDDRPITGRINYTVWSDVFVCPSCSHEIVFYNQAYNPTSDKVEDKFVCPHCASSLRKTDCANAMTTFFDHFSSTSKTVTKQVPVLINYSIGTKKYVKTPDSHDLDIIERISSLTPVYFAPTERMPEGGESRRNDKYGLLYVNDFFTARNLFVLSALWAKSEKNLAIRAVIQSISQTLCSKNVRYNMGHRGNGPLSGTLYIPSLVAESNVFKAFEGKLSSFLSMKSLIRGFSGAVINTGSSASLSTIPDNSIHYIFTDPPFGSNLNYSELSFIWESWLRVETNSHSEAIVNEAQKKGITEYQQLMVACLREYYRILMPSHWLTVEFHNSQNSVWNAISEAIQQAGFIIADVRTLDKQQGSFKQVSNANATKQDLIISAYKPRESFIREFQQRAGDPEMAWEFVRQHLRNVPVTADGNHDGKLDIISERQDFLLFDRMVAWHIMNGIPVPMDAHTFYDGLRQRFLERDGMFFLPDQVNEYDDKRAHMELTLSSWPSWSPTRRMPLPG